MVPFAVRRLSLAVALVALAGCGGGAALSGPGSLPNTAPGGSASSTPSASGTPNPGGPPGGTTTAPPGTTTPPPGTTTQPPGTIATATPLATSPLGAAVAPPDAPGHANVVPATPATGSRPGRIYSIYVTSKTGHTVAFTVFEPATLTSGERYPVVLQGAGFGGSRTTSLAPSTQPAVAGFPQQANTGGNIPPLVAANYGVISFDQTGMGETTGKIRVMDPDNEGVDYLSVLDWAQAKLPWLKFAPTLDGSDASEGVFGSIGGSYGGMYQYLLLNIDPRHRLRAIVPQIAPSNLNFALFPNTVIKAEWDTVLFGLGNSAGSGTSRGNFDPFVTNGFATDFPANAEDAASHDFYAYHSSDYFCNGQSVATNGGAGTMPLHGPTSQTPPINAMIWIGVRDTLFNFNNGFANYACLKRAGGDVRLLSYQSGHNSANIIADPGLAFLPTNDNQDTSCGSLSEDAATLAFFAQYLKGLAGAAAAIPAQPCISLSAGDGVLVPQVTTGSAGTGFDVGSIALVTGAQTDVATGGPVLVTGAPGGTVIAGIPHARIDVEPAVPRSAAAGAPIVFVGLGVKHASNPSVWDLVDNMPTPLRGLGVHDVDLIGGGVRLAPGDQLAVIAYGAQDQYVFSGSVNSASPVVLPVTLTGSVNLPILSGQPQRL